MKVICDVEADDLYNPQNIWCVVCTDVETEEQHVFRDKETFTRFYPLVSLWVGHNFLNFDLHTLASVWGIHLDPLKVLDTLVLSRLLYYSIPDGHSLDAWGVRLGISKSSFSDFSKWSQELEDRCITDCTINLLLYKYLLKYINDPSLKESIQTEHYMSIILNDVHENGFKFDEKKAKELYHSLVAQLKELDDEIRIVFPPKTKLVREITPRTTKHGTLHRQDFRWLGPNPIIDGFTPGIPFSVFEWVEFNPGSPSQLVERLNEAGWQPTEKTKSGNSWKVSEKNLETLPEDAPDATRKLVKRLMLASRVRRLEEWFAAYEPSTGRIHGTINHIGAWTHRCSHQRPNMGNIPSLDSKYTSKELKEIAYVLGKEMRSVWTVDEGNVLVGCDADSIQLRVFAHYVNEPAFTSALVSGDKESGTDPHTLNADILGATRAQAKTFLYAFLLNCGVAKTALIFGCSLGEAEIKRQKFLLRYPGLKRIRDRDIPSDVARGYFEGFDGRKVIIPKDEGNMVGYVLGGYLQNGETCIMKWANIEWRKKLRKDGIWFKQVNFVHDEWQTEVRPEDAEYVGKVQAQSITDAGIHFGLHCPMAGNYKVGANWYETH